MVTDGTERLAYVHDAMRTDTGFAGRRVKVGERRSEEVRKRIERFDPSLTKSSEALDTPVDLTAQQYAVFGRLFSQWSQPWQRS